MRVMIVEPQKNSICGICSSKDAWIKKMKVRGIHGIYCLKCDTLTVFEPIVSKHIYQAFQKEIIDIKEVTVHK